MSNLTPTLNFIPNQPRPLRAVAPAPNLDAPGLGAARLVGAVPPLAKLMSLWQQGPSVDFARFLAEVTVLGAADLLAVVLFDQHQRWQRGQGRRAEEYLQSCPTLLETGGAFELILAEWLQRLQTAEPPTLPEFQQRFPRYAVALRYQLLQKGLLKENRSQTEPLPATPQLNCPGNSSGKIPLPPAVRIPGYRILGELGRGGMGVVYKAIQINLQRPVALKMILGGYCASVEDISRLRSEAQAVARLRHPGIVQVYEIGEHEGLPYYSLELVEGCTLAERLRHQPQSAHDSAALVEALAWAVQHAHQQGVVHRDLKPANVLLSGSREQALATAVPKITDFGIAKRLDDLSHQTRTGVIVGTPSYMCDLTRKTGTPTTRTGVIVGTPSYMAPEQASGVSNLVGPAADVYALGAILYELLTGAPPFNAATAADTLLQVLNVEPVSPRRQQPSVPRDLETICLKCLQKEPSKRYASAAHLAEDLERFQHQEPILARPVNRVERLVKWTRRRPAVAALVGALVVLGLVAFGVVVALWQKAEDTAKVAVQAKDDADNNAKAKEDERRKVEKLLTESLLNQGLALCQKGEVSWGLLILARCLEMTEHQEQETGRPNPLVPVLRHNLALWEGQVSGPLHSFRHADWVWVVAYSPDGRTLATAGRDAKVQLWDVRTGKSLGPALMHPYPVWSLAFAPKGDYLLTGCATQKLDKGCAYLWRLGSSGAAPRQVGKPLASGVGVQDVAFRPDGKRFLTNSADGEILLWEPPANDAAEASIVARISRPLSGLKTAVFSPDNRCMLVGGHDGVVKLHDADKGTALGLVLEHQQPIQALAFSPDGKRFATACGPIQPTKPFQVQLWDTASGDLLARTKPRTGWVRALAFHPNGRSVAAATTIGDTPDKRQVTRGEVLVWQADPAGQPELGQLLGAPLGHPRAVRTLAFSPDGSLLATGAEDGKARLFQTAGGLLLDRPYQAEGTVCSLAFSPDGRTLAMSSAGGPKLAFARLHRIPSGRAQLVAFLPKTYTQLPDFLKVSWSADGRLVAASLAREDSENKTGSTFFWEAATGRPHAVFPDDRRCLFASADLSIVVSADAKGQRQFWRRQSLQPLGKIPGQQDITRMEFSPSGRLAAVVYKGDSLIRLFRTSTGEQVGPDIRQTNVYIRNVTFTRDERFFLVSSYYSYTQDLRGTFFVVYDATTAQPLHKVETSPGIHALACSPDGRWLATGESNRRVRLWQTPADSLHMRTQLFGSGLLHQGRVDSVAFSRDSKLLASASADETAQLWDVATGTALGPSLQHHFRLSAVAIAPQGNRLATALGHGPVVVWRIPPPWTDSPTQAMRRIEELTNLRLDENNQPQPLR